VLNIEETSVPTHVLVSEGLMDLLSFLQLRNFLFTSVPALSKHQILSGGQKSRAPQAEQCSIPPRNQVYWKNHKCLSNLLILFHLASATGQCQIQYWASWAFEPTQDSCSCELI